MCIACREFIKGTLNIREYQSALGEITREPGPENDRHLDEVDEAVRKAGRDAEKLKQRLKEMLGD